MWLDIVSGAESADKQPKEYVINSNNCSLLVSLWLNFNKKWKILTFFLFFDEIDPDKAEKDAIDKDENNF